MVVFHLVIGSERSVSAVTLHSYLALKFFIEQGGWFMD